MSASVPKYRLHSPSGLAVVRINGHDYYLGKHETPESHAEYDRLIAEWMSNGRQSPRLVAKVREGERTVSDLILAYAQFADQYYRKNGVPTGEYDGVRYSLRPLRRLYGHVRADDFRPLALKAVRDEMIKSDLCRNEVNKRIGRIVRMFRWGVENEFVLPMTHHALAQVKSLAAGRSAARESERVLSVEDANIEAIEGFVNARIWAMIRVHRLTGMRPGEVCVLRTVDIDRSGPVWCYRPHSHKTEHHGHERKVWIGPKAQAILKSWLKSEKPDAYLFSPQDELNERSAARRLARKSKVQPSQRKRVRKKNPKRAPRDLYTTASYGRAIRRACEKAGITVWHPHQIRHTRGTEVRKKYGYEASSVSLGHGHLNSTEVYAEIDDTKAMQIALESG